MTKQDKNYIKSSELYVMEQNLLIEVIKQNIDNSDKMIKHHTEMKKLLNETLKHEQKCIEEQQRVFKEWIANKGATYPLELKEFKRRTKKT